jgi:hypothetical protein
MSTHLADLLEISPEQVLQLKKDAAELQRSTGLKRTAALARIAQREGFGSWERLMAKAGGKVAIQEAKATLPPSPGQLRRIERANRFGAKP